LLISEAGGRTYDSDLNTMLDRGDQVIAAGAGVYDEVLDLATHAFTLDANRT
jgi:hypothetical protein